MRPKRKTESPMDGATPQTSTFLGALGQATKDLDMESWKEQGSSCLLCKKTMSLDEGCEWPADPRLLLCWSCMSNVMGELLGGDCRCDEYRDALKRIATYYRGEERATESLLEMRRIAKRALDSSNAAGEPQPTCDSRKP
jgi:hypothetical protein